MSNFFDLLPCQQLSAQRQPDGHILVDGDVDLSGCDIASLPVNLWIAGSLIMRHCPRLSALPSGLDIMDSLDLRNTPIIALPSDMGVGGDILLENTQLASLPANFCAEGALDLEGTPMTSLPANIYVREYLNLRRTGITVLPDDWYVEGPLLIDVEIIRSQIAWRRIPLNALAPDDHIMQDYFQDTTERKSFFWHKRLCEQCVELFAVWVSGEILVFTGGHVGTPGGFERLDISEVFRKAARECVAELEEKLDADAAWEAINANL